MVSISHSLIYFAHMIVSLHCCWNRLQQTVAFSIPSYTSSRIIQQSSWKLILPRLNSSSLIEGDEIASSKSSSSLKSDNELTYAKKYVMIRKNKQSMAFRNGSPLVYSGSVMRTIQIGGQIHEDEHNIEMGSLVGIMVSNENERENTKRNNNNRGRGKGKEKTEIKYNHDIVDKENNRIKTYSMDGNFLSSKSGTKEAEEAISTGKLIGYGFFNPVSMYRVFIFCHQTAHPELFKQIRKIIDEGKSEIDTTESVLEIVLYSKLKDAMRARVQQGLPSTSTDSYRLVNGEGDGLSGLAIDILGGQAAVIMASAAWCELYRETIMKVVIDVLKTAHPTYSKDERNLEIVWRNTPMRLKQDGYILEEDRDDSVINPSLVGKEATQVVITENSIKYITYPFDVSSQKTGFYCDQRDNRLNLAKLCSGKRVLDLCCYNGGFALNAMIHGGATSCVGVDSSPVAIAAAEENKDLNNVSSSLSFVKMDIAEYMQESFTNGDEFDVIILDPPKLAPTINQLDRASRKYHSLNRDAMKLINKKEGGLLLTCTCSGAMTQKNGGQFFLETIQGAALSAGRRITLLSTSGAAPCHTQDPASFPANAYLTAALFAVSPVEE